MADVINEIKNWHQFTEKFGEEYQHLFTKGEFDDSYCVDNFDLALTG